MIKLMRILFVFCLMPLCFIGCCNCDDSTSNQDMKIWFDHPTTKWNSGLPIGNGSLGAMLYGTPEKEIITLNEETIWSGEKGYGKNKKDGYKHIAEAQKLIFDQEYAKAEEILIDKVMDERLPSGTVAYQMLAKLCIERKGLGNVSDFKTALNIENSTTFTSFVKDGVTHQRETFSSAPDQAMLIKYTASEDGAINFNASVNRTANTKIELSEDGIVFSEHVGNGFGVKYHSIINVETTNGSVAVVDGKLKISNADEVIFRIVAASDYNHENPQQTCEERLANVLAKSYDKVLEDHIADYKSLFDRVEIQLSDLALDTIPTDVRLKNIKKGAADNYLTQVQYQFGRYLLISSSREGTLPANLQGIWAEGFNPPWNSDYHLNINFQMNYWPAEMANLSECHKPFLKFVGDLRENGRVTAKESYGCGGFVAHHTSDIWNDTRVFGKPNYGMWPMGAAWCCGHLFSHYEFTEDKEYLGDYAYPVMKEAAEFFVDFMVMDPNINKLVSGPSISPENKYRTAEGKIATINMGPTMDRAIIFELFTNCIKSAKILGIDEDFVKVLQDKMALMPPLEIGSDGRLMEWTEEFDEPQAGHRHISHLYALHPSNQISKSRTPELFDAARKTIDYRLSHGGGHTGWSRAWIINFWARLLDGEEAYKNVLALQSKSTLPNLLDLHPPFQIDGNFGVVAGITEMLMQSHDNEISIFPALPKAWANGHIEGIVARAGFEVDIDWSEGTLNTLTVNSRLGNTLKLRLGDVTEEIATEAGKTYTFNSALELVK